MDRFDNKNCERDNRNRNQENRNRNNDCRNENVEFGTFSSVPGMSQEAKAGTQNAAQKYRNQNTMNSLNQQNKKDTEFAQGIGAQGYNAYSSEAKARTKAAAQNLGSSQGQSK